MKIKKNIIVKEVIKLIQKKTAIKIKNINKNDDLYKKEIVDSFDLLDILIKIEKKFDIKIKVEKENNFKFSINFLTNLIIDKLN